MGRALTSMSKTPTLFCTLPIIWMLLSLSFVHGSFMVSNAGNCSSNEFWYEPIRNCMPFGKRSSEGVPPYSTACPLGDNWYWSSQLSVCLPTSPVPDVSSSDSVSCPGHYAWDTTTSSCVQAKHIQRPVDCSGAEFWFAEKATCIARRDFGPPTKTTIRCPLGWYWNTHLMSCAPVNPEALSSTPTCGSDSVWSPSALICQRAAPSSRRPSPSPSPGKASRRQSLKSRSVSLCPTGLDACPIRRAGDLSDYECIDSKYDLEHCGGCSVDGRGEDCTGIQGAWNVECIQARCSVLTCTAGYVPSIDQRTCVKL